MKASAADDPLGKADGRTLPNRLTPLFSFFGESVDPDPVNNPDFMLAEAHDYTSWPSTASAILLEPRDPFQTIGPGVPGYLAFPGLECVISPCDVLPGASLYVFTTDREPFPGAPPLVPLLRLRYDPDVFEDCDPDIDRVPQRDFAFTTTVAGVRFFKNDLQDSQGFGYDAESHEGFIFQSCEGAPGCTPPPGTVRVYRLYNPDRDDYALFPESEHALLPGSPALGAASPDHCEATDQRGFPRRQGTPCDSGAVEGTLAALDVPTLGGAGLGGLTVMLAGAATLALRRRR